MWSCMVSLKIQKNTTARKAKVAEPSTTISGRFMTLPFPRLWCPPIGSGSGLQSHTRSGEPSRTHADIFEGIEQRQHMGFGAGLTHEADAPDLSFQVAQAASNLDAEGLEQLCAHRGF